MENNLNRNRWSVGQHFFYRANMIFILLILLISMKFRTGIINKKGEYICAVAPVFVVKYCCSVFLRKNGSLGEFYRLLVVDWVC